jgi:hypothetical protein
LEGLSERKKLAKRPEGRQKKTKAMVQRFLQVENLMIAKQKNQVNKQGVEDVLDRSF